MNTSKHNHFPSPHIVVYCTVQLLHVKLVQQKKESRKYNKIIKPHMSTHIQNSNSFNLAIMSTYLCLNTINVNPIIRQLWYKIYVKCVLEVKYFFFQPSTQMRWSHSCLLSWQFCHEVPRIEGPQGPKPSFLKDRLQPNLSLFAISIFLLRGTIR